MKRKAFFHVHILLTIYLLSCLSMTVCAVSITDGLPLSPLPQNWHDNALQELSSVPEGETIVAFDMSEQMGILLITRTETTSEKHLRIINADGSLIAAYSFDCAGSAGVAWDGADICLFFTRGHVIERIDHDGHVIERLELTNSSYEIDRTWNLLAHRKEKRVSTGTFMLRAHGLSLMIGAHEGTELVYIDNATGKETILYDASKAATGKSLAKITFVIVLFSAIIFSLIRRTKQYRNS